MQRAMPHTGWNCARACGPGLQRATRCGLPTYMLFGYQILVAHHEREFPSLVGPSYRLQSLLQVTVSGLWLQKSCYCTVRGSRTSLGVPWHCYCTVCVSQAILGVPRHCLLYGPCVAGQPRSSLACISTGATWPGAFVCRRHI